MKIVQTFKCPPSVTSLDDLSSFACGWSSPELHWMSWIVSAMQAKKLYGNVSVYTDDLGREWFKALKIPFTCINPKHYNIARPSLWSYPKIRTYGYQQSAFLHIDSDVYLFKPLPRSFINSGVCVQHWEENDWDVWKDNYPDRKAELEGFPCKPPYWDRMGTGSYNFGIFGGNDLVAIHRYVSDVTAFVESPANAPHWDRLGRLDRFAWIVEQGIGYAALRPPYSGFLFQRGGSYEDQAEVLGYTHVMNDKTNADANGIGERLRRRCRDDYPDHYALIMSLSK